MQSEQGSQDRHLRIILLGKTGAGKSASGNTILGQKAFEEKCSFGSVTLTCEKHYGEVARRLITVIDVPGLFDTGKREDELKEDIEKCVTMSVPGPHVFLLVIRLDGRFTKEEKDTVKWIQDNFGVRASEFTIVLFTRVDQLKGMPLEDVVKDPEIQEIINKCGGGYHAFNNDEKDDQTQVNQLMEKIDTMVNKNGGEHYTNEMYEDAQRKIEEEEERKRQEEERKRKEYEEKIREMIKKEEKERKIQERKRREEERKRREERKRQEEERKRKEYEEESTKKKKAAFVGVIGGTAGGTIGGAIAAVAGGAVEGTAVVAALGAPVVILGVCIGVVGGVILSVLNVDQHGGEATDETTALLNQDQNEN